MYFKLLWGGVDDNEIARRVLAWVPDDFSGRLLDVPVGTAVFTTEKYKRIKQMQEIHLAPFAQIEDRKSVV